ncbi:MAG: 2-dehydro-3-deoxygalactonokinase [Aliiglaciecola sp.]
MNNSSPQMMILGDWGTSVCRLYLCQFIDEQLTVVDRKAGPGSKKDLDLEQSFFNLCSDWLEEFGRVPVFLIGTVGSNIGWKLVPYVSCPTDQHQLLASAMSFDARGVPFTIFPGLSCQNRHKLPDVMRGEETQIFGFLSQQPNHPAEQLVCLPGTHTKWALLEHDSISSFITSPVGELFEVLSNHSVLLNPIDDDSWDQKGFSEGLDIGLSKTSNIIHTLFATRAKQVLNNQSNTQASCFLSGLLIGADVKAAMQDFHLFSNVVLIGSSKINSLYEVALNKLNIRTEHYTSEWATTCGLQALASERWKQLDERS